MNYAPDECGFHFSWAVPRLDDRRFDLSDAVFIRGH